MKQTQKFSIYVCTVCGYLYDIESAVHDLENNPVPLTQLDKSWTCPVCGVNAALFDPIDLKELSIPQEK